MTTETHTLTRVVRELHRGGDEPALIAFGDDGCERVSWRRLSSQARALGRGLRHEGVEPGERVALYAGNGVPWIVACLGALDAGAVPLPVDAQLAGERLHHVLEDGAPRAVFTDGRGLRRIAAAFDDDPPARAAFRLDRDDADDDGVPAWKDLLRENDDGDAPEPAEDDPAVLFYTSGTTGKPKGVPLTHGQVCFQLRALDAAGVVTADDRVLLPLPAHHVYPFVLGLLAPLALRLPLILPHALTGPELVRAIRDGEATLVIGVPRLYRALLDGIESRVAAGGGAARAAFRAAHGASTWLRRRLGVRAGRRLLAPLHRRIGPRLRTVTSGGAPLSPEVAWRLQGMGWDVISGYGLTETAPMLTLHPAGADRFETVGWPLDGVEIRILPPAEDDGSGDDGGEIAVRGPNVFDGYRNLEERTDEVLDADGWFCTGDLGRFDDDGALRVLGRASTLMVTEGGENVQPDEVEEAYEAADAVHEAGVLQRDDDGALVALVVPETSALAGDDEDPEAAVRAAVKERSDDLPSYQRVAEVRVSREPLPRTRLGDLQRHRLEACYDDDGDDGDDRRDAPLDPDDFAQGDRALLDSVAGAAAWEWLAERYRDEPLSPDTRFTLDLGVDSMEWVELSLELSERTGVTLGEETIAEVDTVRDLLEALAEGTRTDDAGDALAEDPQRLLGARERRLLAPHGGVAHGVRRVLHALERLLMCLAFRLEVRGREHVPARGPWVLAANHTSYLDPFVVAAALDGARLRHVWWGGWVGVAFGNPLTRAASRLAQVIPVDPRSGGLAALAGAATLLARDECLVWFPEGRRSEDGTLGEFRPGLGLLLTRRPVPAVPVRIDGAHEALPVGRRWPRLRRRLTVTFGEPLPADAGNGRDDDDDRGAAILERLRDAIRDL